jgi:hypothetical protein
MTNGNGGGIGWRTLTRKIEPLGHVDVDTILTGAEAYDNIFSYCPNNLVLKSIAALLEVAEKMLQQKQIVYFMHGIGVAAKAVNDTETLGYVSSRLQQLRQ